MDASLSRIKGLGPSRLKQLQAAGIDTVRQLLCCLPVDYRDLSATVPISTLRPGDLAAVEGCVSGAIQARHVGGLHITRARITDGSDDINAVWFNQPWLKQTLQNADSLLLYGRVESAKNGGRQLTCPAIERERGLIPVYKPVSGIPPRTMRQFILSALELDEGQWPDELPEPLRRRHGLCERNFAMREAHAPTSRESLAAARRRLAFEELLLYQAALFLMRASGERGVAIACDPAETAEFWRAMPFPPTGAQRKVLDEIACDLAAPSAMARLVQGDVGCGKTAVAFGALALCAKAGYQGALMAPTEVLARQHLDSAKALLEPMGLSCGLLTGSLSAKEKRQAHEAIRTGAWRVIIGTHALISEAVAYEKLGLVVTDEQHRFGVKQRTALAQKGDAPNVLVMSATPIPRTLSLILYGDLDISIIDELPPGRTPVKTRIVPENKRAGLYGFIRSEVAHGHQAYIVCPLVEESEAVDAKPAEALYEELRDGPLTDLRLGLAHGRMKSAELERALGDFYDKKVDVLVATTVIEVGVNVPNASVMVIESAERFGLAQLHQLRGRVGRGANESWCFLMADANEKLKLLTETNDGFLIAQKDLENRGAGELFGYRQSGLTMPGIGTLIGDTRLLQETHDEVKALFRQPQSEETRAVAALAQSVFDEKLQEIALN